MNCFRVFRAAIRSAIQTRLGSPVQHAPKVVRPKSSTVSATFKTFAQRSEKYFPRNSNVPHAKRQLPCHGFPSSASAPRASSNPGMSGVTRKAVMQFCPIPALECGPSRLSSFAIAAFCDVTFSRHSKKVRAGPRCDALASARLPVGSRFFFSERRRIPTVRQ